MTVPWMTYFPPDWQRVRLRNLIDRIQNGAWGEEAEGDEGVVCIRAADFDRERQRLDDSHLVRRQFTSHELSKHLLQRGDLVLEKSGGGEQQPIGAIILFDRNIPAVATNFAARLRPSSLAEPRFLCYILAAAYALRINQRSTKQTTGIQNLDTQSYFSEPWAIPPVPDQWAIADFLDRETTRIDALIAKKNGLIQLLRERAGWEQGAWVASALKTHGSIPLKRVVESIEQGWSPQADQGPAGPDEWGVLKLSAITGHVFRPDQNKRLANAEGLQERWILQDGDILVARGSGSASLVGRTCVARIGSQRLVVPDLMYRMRGGNQDPDFISLVLNSRPMRSIIESTVRTDVGQTLKIRGDDLANFSVPNVPAENQPRLRNRLETALQPLFRASEALAIQVNLLRERREALVTSVVTKAPPRHSVIAR